MKRGICYKPSVIMKYVTPGSRNDPYYHAAVGNCSDGDLNCATSFIMSYPNVGEALSAHYSIERPSSIKFDLSYGDSITNTTAAACTLLFIIAVFAVMSAWLDFTGFEDSDSEIVITEGSALAIAENKAIAEKVRFQKARKIHVTDEDHIEKIDYKTLEISVLRAMVTSRGISDDVEEQKKSVLIRMLQNFDASN